MSKASSIWCDGTTLFNPEVDNPYGGGFPLASSPSLILLLEARSGAIFGPTGITLFFFFILFYGLGFCWRSLWRLEGWSVARMRRQGPSPDWPFLSCCLPVRGVGCNWPLFSTTGFF